jgi:hypothetical protein
MDFLRRSARKEEKKFSNDTFKANMDVRENILDVNKEKRLRWCGHAKRMPGNRFPRRMRERAADGTRRKGRPEERWMDGVRRSVADRGLIEEGTGDRNMWRNPVCGEEKPLYSGQPLDERK